MVSPVEPVLGDNTVRHHSSGSRNCVSVATASAVDLHLSPDESGTTVSSSNLGERRTVPISPQQGQPSVDNYSGNLGGLFIARGDAYGTVLPQDIPLQVTANARRGPEAVPVFRSYSQISIYGTVVTKPDEQSFGRLQVPHFGEHLRINGL
jgi:hypothetical protein